MEDIIAVTLGILALMIVPLPAFLLDIFLAANITIALAILLVGLYTTQPLDFSVFPSVLLVTTLFRLALNIASRANTRQPVPVAVFSLEMSAEALTPAIKIELAEKLASVKAAFGASTQQAKIVAPAWSTSFQAEEFPERARPIVKTQWDKARNQFEYALKNDGDQLARGLAGALGGGRHVQANRVASADLGVLAHVDRGACVDD